MTTEEKSTSVEAQKKRRASAVSGGIFLICLGVLLITGWWWPGIMFAIGLSGGAELIFRGRIWQGIGTLAFFILLYMLASKFVPLVPVWEVQEGQMAHSLKKFGRETVITVSELE